MNRRTAGVAALAALLVLTAGSAQATPGALDPTFGTGGKVTTSFGPTYDFGNALAIQSDGKILMAGQAANALNYDFALSRYNADGSLDSSFGSGGKVVTPIGSNSDAVFALVIQPDGKIIAAGYTYNGANTDFALARYNADGSLDSTFGSGGKVTTDIASRDDYLFATALQPDGKIVVAGFSKGATTSDDFAVARYNADGTLDASFGTGGYVLTVFDAAYDDVYALLLQPDGKIVAVGASGNAAGTQYFFALARYTSAGALDPSFGSGGKVETAIGTKDDEAVGAVLQPDGKIVAGGYTKSPSAPYTTAFALARYNADGSLDSSFGSGGKMTTAVGTYDSINELAIQPDGRIVAAGYAQMGAYLDAALARYMPDGSLDSTFGTGGKVTLDMGTESLFRAVGLQADGKVVAGGFYFLDNNTATDFLVARYLVTSTLTVTKAGSGAGTVSSSPTGIDCGSTCSAPFSAVPVTLTAAAASDSTFTGWSGDCSGTTATCDLSMSADHSATATFESDKTLTVSKVGGGTGTVTSSPSGIACGSTCSHTYAHGTSVTLTATPSSKSKFAGWSAGACSGTGSCTVTMSADRSATATFKPLCVVPKVKGKKLRAAKRAISRAHCSVGRIKKAFSAKVRKGRVVSQRPRPGAKRPAGSKVKLKVSKGKRP